VEDRNVQGLVIEGVEFQRDRQRLAVDVAGLDGVLDSLAEDAGLRPRPLGGLALGLGEVLQQGFLREDQGGRLGNAAGAFGRGSRHVG